MMSGSAMIWAATAPDWPGLACFKGCRHCGQTFLWEVTNTEGGRSMGKKLEQKEWMLKVEGADGHMLLYGNQCVVLSVTLLDNVERHTTCSP